MALSFLHGVTAFFIAAVGCAGVLAHPVPFSYVDLRLDGDRLQAVLVAHVVDLAHDLRVVPPEALLSAPLEASRKSELADILRSRLRITADGRDLPFELLGLEPLPDRQALAMQLGFAGAGPSTGMFTIACRLFPYDPEHQTFLNIYESGSLTHQEILNRDHTRADYFTGTRQGILAVLTRFLPAGIYHIFTGPDHILFLVGLLLLGGGLLRLLAIVTAFTVAHSITLTLAALDIIQPEPRLIEPAIALSIVYIGVDNLMTGPAGRDVRTWVAFFFGFVHGFGFAAVLREFGLPRQSLGLSLFSFNFGVEIGQACVVVTVSVILALLNRRSMALRNHVLRYGSVAVSVTGVYWFVQRVFL